jgi:hypothetical protein
LHFLRFKHIESKGYKATAKLIEDLDSYLYVIEYKDIDRQVQIRYSSDFPYVIESWKETYADGWGSNPPALTTEGKLMKTVRSDYWTKNSNTDSLLRRELGL